MSGNITAKNMLEDFDNLGKEFASSLFRISRDIVGRQSEIA
jgi:hypothetical protein